MINLLKYELKGRKISALWVVAGVFIVNLLIAIRFIFLAQSLEIYAKHMGENQFNPGINNYMNAIDPFLFITAAVTISIVFLIPLINGIASFSRDYYKYPKYLIASIPQKATSIVGAKLIITIFEAILVSISFFFWLASYAFIFMRGAYIQQLYLMLDFAGKNAMIGIVGYAAYLFQTLLFMLTIYFILIMFKFIKIKKGFAVIIAIIAFNLIGFIQGFSANFFRQISFLDIRLKTYGLGTYIQDASTINVAVVIFYIAFAVALFYATTYLIENKMEV